MASISAIGNGGVAEEPKIGSSDKKLHTSILGAGALLGR